MTVPFDPNRKYVRITNTRANGLIEFVFSVGEPDMAVELILPKAAFDAFCRTNQVTFLSDEAARATPSLPDDWNWTLHQATHQRFR